MIYCWTIFRFYVNFIYEIGVSFSGGVVDYGRVGFFVSFLDYCEDGKGFILRYLRIRVFYIGLLKF